MPDPLHEPRPCDSPVRSCGLYVGLGLLFVTYVFVGIGPANMGAFLDLPSLVHVLWPALAFSLIGRGGRATLEAFRALRRPIPLSPSERAVIRDVYALLALGCVTGGVMGSLIGSINMFRCGIDDLGVMSSGFAVALICPLYSVGFASILWALRYRFRKA